MREGERKVFRSVSYSRLAVECIHRILIFTFTNRRCAFLWLSAQIRLPCSCLHEFIYFAVGFNFSDTFRLRLALCLLALLHGTTEVLLNSDALALTQSRHDLHSELESKQKETLALIAGKVLPRVDLIFLLKAGDSHGKASTKWARIADLDMHEKSNLEQETQKQSRVYDCTTFRYCAWLGFDFLELSTRVVCSLQVFKAQQMFCKARIYLFRHKTLQGEVSLCFLGYTACLRHFKE